MHKVVIAKKDLISMLVDVRLDILLDKDEDMGLTLYIGERAAVSLILIDIAVH